MTTEILNARLTPCGDAGRTWGLPLISDRWTIVSNTPRAALMNGLIRFTSTFSSRRLVEGLHQCVELRLFDLPPADEPRRAAAALDECDLARAFVIAHGDRQRAFDGRVDRLLKVADANDRAGEDFAAD